MSRRQLRLALIWLTLCCSAFMPGVGRAQAVALTFDDLPETGDLPKTFSRVQIGERIEQALVAAKAPPVYGFINAGTLDDPEVVGVLERWRQAGFLLGNHTWSHGNLNTLPVKAYERDIVRNEATLRSLMSNPAAGETPAGEPDWHWYRYPYLAEGETVQTRVAVRGWLALHGYRVAEVTIDFQDHAFNDPYARCVARGDTRSIERLKGIYVASAQQALAVAQQRSQLLFGRPLEHVMLLHFGAFEAVMLPRLLALLQERGWTLVSLPEAEADPVYRMDAGVLNDGGTLLDDLMQARGLKRPASSAPLAELDRFCRR